MDKNNIKTDEKWYAIDTATVVEQLNVDTEAGLSDNEAEKRLGEFGENELPPKKKKNVIIRFLKHFNDILIYVLFVAAIVTAVLGHYLDTAVILLVAVINAVIGFVQEFKAEKTLESIQNMLSLKADVLRNGDRKEIEAPKLTIGDVVLLNPGDKVPADLRLVSTNNLKIEESMLTGESEPSDKNTETLDDDTDIGDRLNMAFSGTTVSAGTGTGIVTAIGKDTEIGKINQMMSEVDEMTTPLLKQTDKFGKTISIVIVGVAILVYIYGYFFGDYEPDVLLLSVIGLAVAAIPEGLPAILSIILSVGVRNMADKKAIIRKLPSVETLGAVSVICSDKTGTLTKNEMTVKTVVTKDNDYDVSGTGYNSKGDITLDKEKVNIDENTVLRELVTCFKLCNDAELGEDETGNCMVKGDPTEGALLTLFDKAEIELDKPERLSTIPFDSKYKYMAILIDREDDRIIYIKGAPDRLLEMAGKQQSESGEEDIDREFWKNKVTAIAETGKRLMGGGYKIVEKDKTDIDHDDVKEGITLLGMAGIIDPPREEAIEAIKQCSEANITVKMITGDHADTAKAIGKEMGIGDGEKAIKGKELEKMNDDELRDVVKEYDVFARTSPEHKLRLVNALQANGSISAMTGDGVNDAPALKKADIGIAMGIKGTEVTKDSAEMVLVDDNFSTIVSAVEEGRRVYDNLKKTILFILPTNGAESFLIIGSILFGTMLPLTPIQILWVNMVTSVTVSLALAFEKAEPDVMQRPPREPNQPLLSGYFIWRILFVSILIGGGTLILNNILLDNGMNETMVRTITLQTIVFTQMFHLFNSRSIRNFAFNKDFFSNKSVFIVCLLMIALQLFVTYVPFMNRILGTVPMDFGDWMYPLIMGIGVFVIVEIEKAVMRKIDTSKSGNVIR